MQAGRCSWGDPRQPGAVMAEGKEVLLISSMLHLQQSYITRYQLIKVLSWSHLTHIFVLCLYMLRALTAKGGHLLVEHLKIHPL